MRRKLVYKQQFFKNLYNIYLNQIWYRTQIPHYKHAGMAKFT